MLALNKYQNKYSITHNCVCVLNAYGCYSFQTHSTLAWYSHMNWEKESMTFLIFSCVFQLLFLSWPLMLSAAFLHRKIKWKKYGTILQTFIPLLNYCINIWAILILEGEMTGCAVLTNLIYFFSKTIFILFPWKIKVAYKF